MALVAWFVIVVIPCIVHAQSTFQYDANGNLTNVTAAVAGPPMITVPPMTQNAYPGTNVAFSVSAIGPGSINYQWYDNGALIQGATNSTLFIPSVTPSNQGSYSVVVCNGSGCVTSAIPALLEFAATWVALGTSDWYNPASWSPAIVPTGFSSITIPAGAIVNLSSPVTITGNLTWSGGTLSGSPLTIATNGIMNIIGSNTLTLFAALTIATNGILNISGSNTLNLYGVLTNAGTVNWAGTGNLEIYNYSPVPFGYTGGIVNQTGAVFNVQNDQTIIAWDGVGSPYFSNAGTFLKSAGTNTTINVAFNNSGLVNVESGMVTLNGGGIAGGFFSGTADLAGGTFIVSGLVQNPVLTGATLTGSGGSISNLTWSAGTLAGINTLTGVVNWTGGSIGAGSTLTIATNGILNISGSNTLNLYGVLTNAGTVNWAGTGNLEIYNYSPVPFGYTGGIVNQTGAVFNVQNDQTIIAWDGVGSPYFSNAGTFLKSAGTNTTINVAFNNSGLVNVESGMVTLNGGGIAGGFFSGTADLAGGTFIVSGLVQNPVLTGATLTGSGGSISNLTWSAGTLAGINTLTGVVNWTGGSIGAGSTLTIATNSIMNISGSNMLNLYGVLTNAGTVNWAGTGNLEVYNYSPDGYTGGIVNQVGAVFNVQNDQTIIPWDGVGSPYFNNAGTFLKSAGTNTTINVTFNNNGVVEVNSGTVTFNGSLTGNNGSLFTGEGTNVLGGSGTFSLNGSVTISNLLLAVAYLSGNGSVSGSFGWTSGSLGAGSTLTIASNGNLNISGSSTINLYGVLTNAGTVNWAGTGSLEVYNYSPYGYTGGIVNQAGAVFNVQNDQGVFVWDGVGSPYFNNAGTFLKSAGTNTTINVAFNNSGLVNVQSGMLTFNGSVAGNNGSVFSGAGTNLLGGAGTFTVNGSITVSNLLLGVATLSGNNGMIHGLFTWTSGSIGAGSTLTIASNAIMNISGSSTINLYGVLTNAGTVNWAGTGSLEVYNYSPYGYTGGIVNQAGAVFNVQNDQGVFVWDGVGSPYFNNAGTFLKSAGTNTTINVAFNNNTGTLNAQSGTISLNGSYTFTGGTMDVGISGATNYGIIHFAGSVPLNGLGLNINLENGFVPAVSNSFAVVTYGSRSGVFATANLPSSVVWQTNYGSTAFTLTVLGVRPVVVPSLITNGAPNQPLEFSLQFAGSTNSLYTVFATTNLALPFSNWATLGNASLLSNDLFQFIDTNSTNFPARFYMLRSP